MKKSHRLGAAFVFLAAVSINANAVVKNTLNGVDYVWLELSATTGMSRLEVEAQISDENSSLYGYEYASRTLVQDLFLSYSSWDGLNGWHSESSVLAGAAAFHTDFGVTIVVPQDGFASPVDDVHGTPFLVDGARSSRGLYGLDNECGGTTWSCNAIIETLTDVNGADSLTLQGERYGWDATVFNSSSPARVRTDEVVGAGGSFLVRTSVAIDIKPSKKRENVISLKKDKNLKVAIVGTESFEALQVDPTTVKFGPTGVEASPVRFKGQDYNRDGFSDLVLTFKLADTGIACGDTDATLTGKTLPDPVIAFQGTDNFTVEGCS